MAIQSKIKTKHGIDIDNGYIRISKIELSHWIDNVWKLFVIFDIYADIEARNARLEPIEKDNKETFTIIDTDIEQGIFNIAYRELKSRLGNFKKYKNITNI